MKTIIFNNEKERDDFLWQKNRQGFELIGTLNKEGKLLCRIFEDIKIIEVVC